jgi:hypothetical protein
MNTPFCITMVALVASVSAAYADKKSGDFSCNAWDLRIETADHLYLGCGGKGWPAKQPHFEIWREQDDPREGPVNITGAGSILPAKDGFLEINLATALAAKSRYLLLVKPKNDRNPVDLKVDFSTEAKAPISAGLAQAQRGKVFNIGGGAGTHIAFSEAATHELREQSSPGGTVHKIPVQAAITAKTQTDCKGDPLCIGKVNITADRRLRASKETVELTDLKDVFGQPVDTKATVDLAAPPKGKDDADQYYQISHKAGPGSKPSLSINVKTNSLPFWFGNPVGTFYVRNYLVQPSAAIDVATNDFAQKSDNRISLGLKGSRTWITSKERAFFQGVTFGPGFSYETNLGFKKNNFVVNYDTRLYFKNLYRTREQLRYDAATTSIDTLNPDDFKFGYGIEMLPGLEVGGSPWQQTVNNKPNTLHLDVDQYPIFRFKPTLHSFIEYDRFSVDWSGTMRMLVFTELVGQEAADHKLYLRHIQGLQNYMEVTGSIGIDQSKHTSLTVTYKRGAQPPAYPHTQTVVTGFTVKF